MALGIRDPILSFAFTTTSYLLRQTMTASGSNTVTFR